MEVVDFVIMVKEEPCVWSVEVVAFVNTAKKNDFAKNVEALAYVITEITNIRAKFVTNMPFVSMEISKIHAEDVRKRISASLSPLKPALYFLTAVATTPTKTRTMKTTLDTTRAVLAVFRPHYSAVKLEVLRH